MPPTPPRYPIPAGRFRREIVVKRSRFLATLEEVRSAEEARAFVAEIAAEFPDADHNCWAYLVGPPGATDRIGLSDDGEPHGAAGRPILTCIEHGGLGDVAVVVTRYFGGVKLGRGGMVKAYTAAAKAVLDEAPRAARVAWCGLFVTVDYAIVGALQRRFGDHEVEVLGTERAARVRYRLRLPEERVSSFERAVTDLCAGRCVLERAATSAGPD